MLINRRVLFMLTIKYDRFHVVYNYNMVYRKLNQLRLLNSERKRIMNEYMYN